MAALSQFLKTGSLGPIVLGMDPVEVFARIGTPQEESQKKNPLTVKYGSLQLVFWKHGPRSQLRDISLHFLPEFSVLPPPIAFDDFKPGSPTTERYFLSFLRRIHYLPVHQSEEADNRRAIFLSGVVVNFFDGLLDTIRIAQKRTKETTQSPLSDVREPSQQQILEMIEESEEALRFESRRSALIMAWAALEATLRRVALLQGLRGQIGVQPTILIRELLSLNVLTPEDSRRLEKFRQLRTASVHGLAPVGIERRVIHEINGLTKRLLGQNEFN